ncbi:response regulator [Flavobacterium sp. ASW18X]|nr:response regulator [Flavobacterium sp. ASW18X]
MIDTNKIIFTFFLTTIVGLSQKSKEFSNLSNSDSIIFQDYRKKVVVHINPKPDSALFYIQKMRTFSFNKNYKIGIADTEYTMGHYYRRIQNMDSALFYYAKSKKIALDIKYNTGAARALNALCRGYYLVGKIDLAKDTCEECLRIASPTDDTHIIVDTYTALGNTYARENNFSIAVNYFLKADSIHQKKPQRPDIIAADYQSLGNVYKELNDYKKSIEYYLKANKEFEKLPVNKEYFVNNTNMQLGTVYYLNNDISKSDSLLTMTLEYFKNIKDENAQAQTSTYLGLTKLELGKLDEAEKLLTQGYTLNRDNKFSYETTEARLKLAELYLKNDNPKKAAQHLEGVLENNIEGNKGIEANALEKLAQAYHSQGLYEKAYSSLQKAKQLKDSIGAVQNQATIRELETIYETSQKEQEIALLKSENELVQQRQKSQKNILLTAIGLTTLTGVFLFFLYRNRQKTNKKLMELDMAKSNFFTNITHELRTPLSLIRGPIEQQLSNDKLSIELRNGLTLAKKNSERLEELVDQIMNLSKLESGQYQLKVSLQNPEPFIKSILSSFEFNANQKEQNYNTHINLNVPDAWFDQDVLQKILTNLIGNAIKYSPEKEKVLIDINDNKDQLFIKVSNSGTSLSNDELKQLFNRFYRAKDTDSGTGIGLALTKELVELHKGQIKVDSSHDEVAFTVQLPISKNAFSSDEKLSFKKAPDTLKIDATDAPHEIGKIDTISNKDLPILLVVDDNEELRNFVGSLFEKDYQIHLKENGKTGFELAQEIVPDIIITDLMMPEEDGLLFTKKCKTSDATSHIPIIMLTAKAGDENTLVGLEYGADAYLTKPFNTEILRQQAKNLLETQQKIQQRFSKEVVLTPKDISINSYDERFLTNLQNILDDKLVESDFNTENFAQALGMSRMQLHRKLKALTGQSTTEFIRIQRLKLAAGLLKKSDVNVSEIGYSVGFNNHSYFTKSFKEHFGVSPTEYSTT